MAATARRQSSRSAEPTVSSARRATCVGHPGVPAITYGLRGITYFELKLTGPSQDLRRQRSEGRLNDKMHITQNCESGSRDRSDEA